MDCVLTPIVFKWMAKKTPKLIVRLLPTQNAELKCRAIIKFGIQLA